MNIEYVYLMIKVFKQTMVCERAAVVANTKMMKCRFTFDGTIWNQFAGITACFKAFGSDITYNVLLANGECIIPHEVLVQEEFYIALFGDEKLPTTVLSIKVQPSGILTGVAPPEVTPTVYEQMLTQFQVYKTDILAIKDETNILKQDTEAIKEEAVVAKNEAQSYAKFGTFRLQGNMLVATIEAANDITDIKINDEGKLVIRFGNGIYCRSNNI